MVHKDCHNGCTDEESGLFDKRGKEVCLPIDQLATCTVHLDETDTAEQEEDGPYDKVTLENLLFHIKGGGEKDMV